MLPTDARRQNLSLVLQRLYSDGPMSRADLSRRIGLTKVTVSELVDDLLTRGHVVELGPSDEVRPGKPAVMVDVDRDGLQLVGIDLTGPHSMRAAVLDLRGGVIDRVEKPMSPGRPGDELLADVISLARETVRRASHPVLGVGVGTPGTIGPNGVVHEATNLGWTDLPLGALLSEALGHPVSVVNDADAAVNAEHTLGTGGDDLLLVKVGLGLGCGVIVDGRRVHGAHFSAGEIGHVTDGDQCGELCRCGRRGCIETWLSVPRLEQALAVAPQDALALLSGAGVRLAAALAPVVAVLDPSVVALCGPARIVDGPLLDAFASSLRARMLSRTAGNLEVRWVSDVDIVLRGAAALVLWDRWGVA